MSDQQRDTTRLAEAVRRACIEAAAEAYEQAREDGLCAEGAWEVAIAAILGLDLKPILVAAGGRAEDSQRSG